MICKILLLNINLLGNNFFMKNIKVRFAVFCLLVIAVVALPVQSPVFKKNYDNFTTYYFFAKTINHKNPNAKYVKNGNAYVVSCKFEDAKEVKNGLFDVLGESIKVKNYSQTTKNDILKRFENLVVSMQFVDKYVVLQCYDKSLENYLIVDGKKVNIQIALTDAEINIGYPLILNGF